MQSLELLLHAEVPRPAQGAIGAFIDAEVQPE